MALRQRLWHTVWRFQLPPPAGIMHGALTLCTWSSQALEAIGGGRKKVDLTAEVYFLALQEHVVNAWREVSLKTTQTSAEYITLCSILTSTGKKTPSKATEPPSRSTSRPAVIGKSIAPLSPCSEAPHQGPSA